MNILFVIDSLGSGGAQKQITNLACGLKNKSFNVEFLVYYPDFRFFRPILESHNITIHEVQNRGGFSLIILIKLISLFNLKRYHAVISFLDTPNIYCELAKIFTFKNFKLIVSERNSYLKEKKSFYNRARRYLHIFAHHIVANSYNHAHFLKSKCWLKNKTLTIYNGYSINKLKDIEPILTNKPMFNFLIVGRICTQKNGLRILQAFIHLYNKSGFAPKILWAGRQEDDGDSLQERMMMDKLLQDHPDFAINWKFLGERQDIPELLKDADALVHLSLYEGLPNVVCEAFIAGRPVIASRVCDHPVLVEDRVRGILCDPFSVNSIISGVETFINLSSKEIERLGINARQYAEEFLSIERMVNEYEKLITN